MIGKFKFVVVTDGAPIVIWEKTIEAAREEFVKKEPTIAIKEILPNKEFLKKFKKAAHKIPVPANITVPDTADKAEATLAAGEVNAEL